MSVPPLDAASPLPERRTIPGSSDVDLTTTTAGSGFTTARIQAWGDEATNDSAYLLSQAAWLREIEVHLS
jgi:hypothetical protein